MSYACPFSVIESLSPVGAAVAQNLAGRLGEHAVPIENVLAIYFPGRERIMDQRWIKNKTLRAQTLAVLLAPFVITASGATNAMGQNTDMAPAAAATTAQAGPGTASREPPVAEGAVSKQLRPPIPRVYSVINLAPDGLGAFLNERGQAAFSSYVYMSNGFFDGDRLHNLPSLDTTLIQGLNNRGMVVGITHDDAEPISNVRAFSWTLARGLRLLPELGGAAFGVNDRNQLVGSIPEMNTTGRAVRWEPNGQARPLGPVPPLQSLARAINNRSVAGGFANVADGSVHAMLWDPAGRQTDLGTLRGQYSSADFVNERGQAAGQDFGATDDPMLSFFWSDRSGMVGLVPPGEGDLFVSDLNDQGRIAGIVQARDQPALVHAAYRWSLSGGFSWLAPVGPGIITDVTDLNNWNQMVGSVERPEGGPRAVRWDGMADPVDLNTQLYRPPAGLVVHSGRAINDTGTILAYSSAGLVMLRPGTRGTDAPVLGPITGLPTIVELGQEVHATVGFVDNSRSQTHRAAVTWDDNCTSPHPALHEADGVGQVTFQHRFCVPGIYDVTVNVTDSGGRATSVAREYVVNEPGMPAISGQGELIRRAGRDAQALRFTLWAPLNDSAATEADASAISRARFRTSGAFEFKSDRVSSQSRTANLIRLQGTGRYNGRAGYRFLVEATDGERQATAGGDHLRVRVSHTGPDGAEVVDYDNGATATANGAVSQSATGPDRTMVVGGGVTLHD